MSEDPSGSRPDQDEGTSQRQRAEDVLEDWGRRAGRFIASAAVRVREEAEDIWAEAQSIKRGERE